MRRPKVRPSGVGFAGHQAAARRRHNIGREIDFVIQLRYAPETADCDHDKALQQEIERIAKGAEVAGVPLAAVEIMENVYNPGTRTSDHFGFRDGLSQPDVLTAPAAKPGPNQVRLGELLCGYSNDRGDIGDAFASV